MLIVLVGSWRTEAIRTADAGEDTRKRVCVYGGGGVARFGPSAEQFQVGDGDFSFVVAALSDQPIRIHPW